jgi:hypothetical protein
VWCVILVLAFVNAGLREIMLIPRFGNVRSLAASGVILSLLVLAVAYVSLPWMGAIGTRLPVQARQPVARGTAGDRRRAVPRGETARLGVTDAPRGLRIPLQLTGINLRRIRRSEMAMSSHAGMRGGQSMPCPGTGFVSHHRGEQHGHASHP